MATKIEWATETWNPIVGCSPVSEGCRNCYAARDGWRLMHSPHQRTRTDYARTVRKTKAGRPVFTGKVNVRKHLLDQPLRWKRPRRIFVPSMGDLFHENVPDEVIDQIFAVMALARQHTFIVTTKRPERMAEYMISRLGLFQGKAPSWEHPVQKKIERIINERPTPEDAGLWKWPLPNVWLGVSVENQATADERIPALLETPAAVRWLSCEPLLGPVDLRFVYEPEGDERLPFPCFGGEGPTNELHWVVVGGESGPGARPMNTAWVRDIVFQCGSAKVPVFVKQLGANPVMTCPTPCEKWPDSETEYGLEFKSKKGGDPEEWPADLRVREYPEETGGTP